jgi:hypothetical protein
MRIRIQLSVNADPDPAFHLMRIRIQLFTSVRNRIRIRILLSSKSVRPSRLHFEPPGLHCEPSRLYFEPPLHCERSGLYYETPGLHCECPRLYCKPLNLMKFYFTAVLDRAFPAFRSNADPDPASKKDAVPYPECQKSDPRIVRPWLRILIMQNGTNLYPGPDSWLRIPDPEAKINYGSYASETLQFLCVKSFSFNFYL